MPVDRERSIAYAIAVAAVQVGTVVDAGEVDSVVSHRRRFGRRA